MRAENCNDCGCLPCCCVTNTDEVITQENVSCPHIVRESVGSCGPLQPDPLDLINNHCCPPEGGDKTIQAPIYVFTVENPPDDVIRDSEGRPVLDENGNVMSGKLTVESTLC